MSEDRALFILKKAILLERRGKAFYRNAAEKAGTGALRDFFRHMAEEEDRHIEILSKQFHDYTKTGRFAAAPRDPEGSADVAASVLSKDLQDRISASGFEAAAISAAMAMEERAVKLYSRREEETPDDQERALYRWLADFERGHLKTLAEMDRVLTERVWFDNQFWPF